MSDSETLDTFLHLETTDQASPDKPERFTEDQIVDLICQYDDADPDHLIPHHITTTPDHPPSLTSAFYWSVAHNRHPHEIGYRFVTAGHHTDGSFFETTALYRFTYSPLNQAEIEFYYDYLTGKTDDLPKDTGVYAGPSIRTSGNPRIRPLASDESIDPETQSRVKIASVARYRDGKWTASEEEVPYQELQSVRKQATQLRARTRLPIPSPD